MSTPWWKSHWFWGGAVPLLPVAAIAILAVLGIEFRDAGWVVAAAAVPLLLFFATAVLGLGWDFVRDLRTDETARRAILTVLTIVGAFLLLAAGVAADDCVWEGEGGTVQQVQLPDYNYAFQPRNEYGTLCVVLRSPEATTLACDSGREMSLELGRENGETLIVLDTVIYRPRCD